MSEPMSGPDDEPVAFLDTDLSELVRRNVRGEVDAETADRWRRGLLDREDLVPLVWSPKVVDERLVDAVRLIERTTSRVGPASYGRGSPAYINDEMDRWYQESQEAAEIAAGDRERNRVKMGATAAQVANADRAIGWPGAYLGEHPNERAALQIYLFCKAKRLSWQKAVKKRGIAAGTAKDRKTRALRIIAGGLNRDEVKVWERR